MLVWATNRQSLCDSLPQFKSHHGGIYTKDKEPHGVLFGRMVEIGDVMLGDKGIYHMLVPVVPILRLKTYNGLCNRGGGRTLGENGAWTRDENYKPKDTTAWETAKEQQSPILVIMGKCFSFEIR